MENSSFKRKQELERLINGYLNENNIDWEDFKITLNRIGNFYVKSIVAEFVERLMSMVVKGNVVSVADIKIVAKEMEEK